MSFKSVLGKIGKVALTAAPYVAAPFTGGASLMATGLANKAVQKWSEHDAKAAAAKGLAPSNFDKVLGRVGAVSSLASSFIPTNALGAVGMLGKAGSAASKAGSVGKSVADVAGKVNAVGKTASTASKIGKVLGTAAKVAGPAIGTVAAVRAMRGGGDGADSGGIGPSESVARNAGAVMPRGGYGWNANPMNQLDQSSPNLSQSIFQGRQEAIKNQPFRKGYDVTTQYGEPDEAGKYQTRTTRMPAIVPNTRSQRRDEEKDKKRKPVTGTETKSRSRVPQTAY
jgi:hypothetical protein